MIIYNVTVKVEERIAPDWLKWLKGEHIPEILATGCFTEAVVFDLLEPYDGEGVTFVVQYKTKYDNRPSLLFLVRATFKQI